MHTTELRRFDARPLSLAAVALLYLLLLPVGVGEEIAADAFNYDLASLDGLDGGLGWGEPWSAEPGIAFVVDTDDDPLEFEVPGGALASDEGRALELIGNHDNLVHRGLAEVMDRDELFVSFLFRFLGTLEDNDYVGLWLDSTATGTHTAVPSIGLKANRGNGSGPQDIYARTQINQETFVGEVEPGETCLIVGRLAKDAPGALQPYSRFELWVNPSYADRLTPQGTATGESAVSFDRVGVRVPTLEFDDTAYIARLVIGETWDDVVPPPPVVGTPFLRADSNVDGAVNLTDPVFALNYLFVGGPEPPCLDAADADDDGTISITDAVFTLNGLFVGGPQPPEPGAEGCGPDPSDDALGCSSFAACP